ncbi:MAG: nitronate monooxygenase [Candidatus Eremiobacteraeota bacterium]|nr:nitronate monooxygenase [Candidatus Eremiobacteraeota bacterium]
MRVPIFNAPMTPQAGGALAGAVSDAGGLGMLGMDEDEPAPQIREQIAVLKTREAPNFGIGFVIWLLERRPELVELAIDAQPKIVSISFGDPSPYVERFHDAGILVASQVQNRKWAKAAIDAGVDIVVAQGTEAGGHTGAVGTLPLLQIVLGMTDRPVIAAGGIATGSGIAAVLAAGAQAAWIGTPFLLAAESRSTPQAQERISAADETQTIHTSVFDRVQHKPWPAEFKGRALRNPFAEKWNEREDDLMRAVPEIERFHKAKEARDYTTANIYAGQSVGLIRDRRPAKEIVENFTSEAIACLDNVSTLIQ